MTARPLPFAPTCTARIRDVAARCAALLARPAHATAVHRAERCRRRDVAAQVVARTQRAGGTV